MRPLRERLIKLRVSLKSPEKNQYPKNRIKIYIIYIYKKYICMVGGSFNGSRLTFSYISSSSFTFPGAPYRIFLLFPPWLPCHLYPVVLEQQQSLAIVVKQFYNSSSLKVSISFFVYAGPGACNVLHRYNALNI